MVRLIVHRLAQSVFVVLGTSFIVFALLVTTSGDIVVSMLPEWATPEEIAAYKKHLGLDLPVYLQYFHWLGNVLHGDFGTSYQVGRPALNVILERLPATLELALVALVAMIVVSFPLGILAAVRRGSIWDRLCMTFAVMGQSIPHFWLGLMLILIVAVKAGWLPVSGRSSPTSVILPALTLATGPIATMTRLVRSGMLEVLSEDYIRTARAKGLRETAVLGQHALRNALLPLITVVGLQIGMLLNGSVVIETVFAWPGIGRLIITSLNQRDIPLVVCSVFLVSVLYIFINLVVDLLYNWVDPRVRYDA